jgi:hypothetical protein
LVVSEWFKGIESSCSNEVGRMGAVLHEGVHDGGRVEIQGAVHEDGTKRDKFSELSMKGEALFRPILAQRNRMGNESGMRVMENSKNRLADVVDALHAMGRNGVGRKHGAVLKCTKDIVLPVEETSRLVGGKIFIEFETLAATVTLFKKLVWKNADSVSIAIAGKQFMPHANARKSDVVTIGEILMEFLWIADRGEDRAVANNDLFSCHAWLAEALAMELAVRCRKKFHKLRDGNDDVRVLVVIVTLLCIRRKKLVPKFVRRHWSWLGDCGRQVGWHGSHADRRRSRNGPTLQLGMRSADHVMIIALMHRNPGRSNKYFSCVTHLFIIWHIAFQPVMQHLAKL